MKLAFPVATPEVAVRTLAWAGDIAEIAPRLRQMGYSGVELFVRDPRSLDPSAIAAEFGRHDLQVAAVGTGPVAVEDRLTFTAPDPAVRTAAIERACAVIEFAAHFGAQVNIGKLRGNISSEAQAGSWRDEAFRVISAHASRHATLITLEPQHRGIIDNLNGTLESLAWLDCLALPNLRLMLDSHHMHFEEPSTAAALAAARHQVVHIHLSDTRRLAPGRGSIDFAAFLRVLRALGYDRFLTVEIEQAPDSATAAADAADYILALLKRL
jgi:sugar phosphate isomerase/epimerase